MTDDTEAIQWYFDHGLSLPVTLHGYTFRAEVLRLPTGAFLSGGRQVVACMELVGEPVIGPVAEVTVARAD